MLPGLGDILPESRNLVTTQALPQTLLEEGTCLSGHTCVSACCPRMLPDAGGMQDICMTVQVQSQGDLQSQPDTGNYTFKQVMQAQNTTYEIDLCPSQLKQVIAQHIHDTVREACLVILRGYLDRLTAVRT